MLGFEVEGDRTNVIDIQNIFWKWSVNLLEQKTLIQIMWLEMQVVSNTLRSLISDCTVTAQGVNVFSANGLYAHKAFIVPEFSHNDETKNTCLECQGCSYESSPSTYLWKI